MNTLFKYLVGYRQLIFIIEMFKLLTKSCAKFYLLCLNINVQLHVELNMQLYIDI